MGTLVKLRNAEGNVSMGLHIKPLLERKKGDKAEPPPQPGTGGDPSDSMQLQPGMEGDQLLPPGFSSLTPRDHESSAVRSVPGGNDGARPAPAWMLRTLGQLPDQAPAGSTMLSGVSVSSFLAAGDPDSVYV